MNRKIKEAIKAAFDAPAPVRKQEFLRNIPLQRMSIFSFMLSQAGYIRKWVPVLSLFIFALSLAGACLWKLDMLWIISAFMPLLALSAVTENSRSATYGMDELEMSSRFSLRNVVLARMGIMGVLHLILLCLLMPLACVHSIFTIMQVGVYLLIPYLAADVTGLWLVRNIRGKEGLYACAGVSVCISGMHCLLRELLINILYMNYFEWLIVSLIVLIILCIRETKKTVEQTEELRWNLS